MTQEITNTILCFFVAVDEGNWDTAQKLMKNPFLLDYSSYGGGPAAELDPADIIKAWQGVLPGFDATQHQLGSLEIKADDMTAKAKCNVIASHQIAEAEGGEVWIVHGTYDICLSLHDGRWQLNALTFNYKFQNGNKDLPAFAQQRAIAP